MKIKQTANNLIETIDGTNTIDDCFTADCNTTINQYNLHDNLLVYYLLHIWQWVVVLLYDLMYYYTTNYPNPKQHNKK